MALADCCGRKVGRFANNLDDEGGGVGAGPSLIVGGVGEADGFRLDVRAVLFCDTTVVGIDHSNLPIPLTVYRDHNPIGFSVFVAVVHASRWIGEAVRSRDPFVTTSHAIRPIWGVAGAPAYGCCRGRSVFSMNNWPYSGAFSAPRESACVFL